MPKFKIFRKFLVFFKLDHYKNLIISGVNGTKKSAPVIESDQRAISAQVQVVQNEMTKLKKMISMKNQRRKTVQESTSIVKTSESVTADISDKN